MSPALSISSSPVCRGRLANVELRPDVAVCVFGAQSRLLLSRFLGSRVAMRDEITFAAPTGDRFGTQILITKHAVSGRNRYFYQAPIGYVTQPKTNKRNELAPPCTRMAHAVNCREGRKRPSLYCSCGVEDPSSELADFKLPLGILGFARYPALLVCTHMRSVADQPELSSQYHAAFESLSAHAVENRLPLTMKTLSEHKRDLIEAESGGFK